MAVLDRLEVSRLRGSGTSARRVLLVGDRQYLGGAEPDTGPAGLVGSLAARGWPDLDVDVLTGLVPALRAIGGATAAWRLWRYDLVVLVLDDADPRQRSMRLQRVMAEVLAQLASVGRLLVVLPERTGAGRGRRAHRGWRTALDAPQVSTLSAETAEDGGLAAPHGVTEALLAVLVADDGAVAARERRAAPQDEPLRQDAVDRSVAEIGAVSLDLQRVVILACGTFGVPYAQVNLVDRGTLRSLAFVGRSSDALRDTMSQLVVQQDRALMVEDTQADRRFDAVPETHGPDAIRYYAGHPIESLDGYRIGTLCVFDTVPHPVLEGDEQMLRDIALLAEGEIGAMRHDVEGRRRPPRG